MDARHFNLAGIPLLSRDPAILVKMDLKFQSQVRVPLLPSVFKHKKSPLLARCPDTLRLEAGCLYGGMNWTKPSLQLQALHSHYRKSAGGD